MVGLVRSKLPSASGAMQPQGLVPEARCRLHAEVDGRCLPCSLYRQHRLTVVTNSPYFSVVEHTRSLFLPKVKLHWEVEAQDNTREIFVDKPGSGMFFLHPNAIGQSSVTWPRLTTGRLGNEVQLRAQVDKQAGCGERLAVSAVHPSYHLLCQHLLKLLLSCWKAPQRCLSFICH